MKTCPPCNGDCQQSDTCPARELPITMDEPLFTFDHIAELFRDLLALIGFVAMLAIIAFAWGYNV